MDNTTKSHILQLQEAMKQNRLVVFAGAGASASVGVPTWPELIQSFKSELPDEMYDEGDALKTAEAYRELRGDVEYLSHIKKVLKDGEISRGLVHDAIVNLNPCHIITTNYDDLLEQAAIYNNKQYYVVAKDEDLPLNQGEKMIIKMHGDFVNNNIVLTENDYYDYRRNFPLINAFLLSLFATKVVLFVGFSFNDINLKFILRHVSSALGNKMQRVYLLADRNRDPLAYSYFKNKSIQLLSIPESVSSAIIQNQKIEIGDEKSLQERSRSLYLALSLLRSYNPNFESIVDYAIDALSKYQDQIRYWGEELSRIFNPSTKQLVQVEESCISFMDDAYKMKFEELLKERAAKPLEYKQKAEKIEWIRNRLIENGIRYIERTELFTEEQRTQWLSEVQDNFSSVYYRMDFAAIEEKLKRLNNRSLNYTIDDLELPFLLYRLGRCRDAYFMYKTLAPKMWERRKYVLYFICLYNVRASFGRAFMQMLTRGNEMEHEMTEVYSLSLDKILAELPIDQNVKGVLETLVNGVRVKNLLIKTSALRDKLSEQKKNAERGGMSINGHINQLLNEYGQAFNFCNENYILLDAIEDTQNAYNRIGEGLINSVLTPAKDKQLQTKIEEIPEIAVELYVFLVEPSDLVKILKVAEGKKIPVEIRFKRKLQEIVTNLESEWRKNQHNSLLNPRLTIQYISNIILLLNAIEEPLETPELYRLIASCWGNGLLIDSHVKVALSRVMEKFKPSPSDAMRLLVSLSQSNSHRQSDEANLICVLAKIVSDGKLIFKDFPGPKYLSKYQGVESIGSYYHALSAEEQSELITYVRENVKDMITLVKTEIHTEAHYISSELIKELLPTLKNSRSSPDAEEFCCYIFVRMLNEDQYADIHESIMELKDNNEVFRFLYKPETFPVGKIKAKWLRFVTDEQLKNLYENKTIRKIALEYSEENKWYTSLIDKMHQFDKED